MSTRLHLLTGIAALLLGAAGFAAPVTPAVRAEVDAMLARLAASGCGFNRNGSWHTAAEARAHLLGKLEYLEGKDLIQTTEQFIERAASGSSVSGKPYLVKCGNAAPVESRLWLATELKVIRASGKAPAAAGR